MNHVMVDLETMGNNPNAPIVSIGAVFFNPVTCELGPEFYTPVALQSEIDNGAKPDADTILWWLKQDQAVREAIWSAGAVHINTALANLRTFITSYSPDCRFTKVWGNGANFDNVILRQSFERAQIPCPWMFWNDCDVRTMVMLGRELGFDPKRDMPFDGVLHNALADARHQAKYVSAIWQRLLPVSA